MLNEHKEVPCSIYSRVTGYYQPVSNWNKGKQSEFEDRYKATITAETVKSQK